MYKIRVNPGIVILLFTLLFWGCKSADLTIMGLYEKKIAAGETTDKDSTEILQDNSNSGIPLFYGIIKDQYDNPVFEPNVYLQSENGFAGYTKGDENGNYSINKVFTKSKINTDKTIIKCNLKVTAEGFGEKTIPVKLFPDSSFEQNFILTKLGSISGTVYGSDGNPVKEIDIFAYGNSGESYFSKTDASGFYTIENLEDDSYTVEVFNSISMFPQREVNISGGDDVTNLNFNAAKGEIKGRILSGETKLPINRSVVSLTPQDLTVIHNGLLFEIKDTTDKEGNFSFTGLRKGEYIIKAVSDGMGEMSEKAEVQKEKTAEYVDLLLLPEGIISGKISGYGADEKSHFSLIDKFGNIIFAPNLEIEDDGKYIIKNLAGGVYSVTCYSGDLHVTKENIVVKSGKTTTGQNFEIPHGSGVIKGKVTTKSGDPLFDVMVFITSEQLSGHAFTDEKGLYELSGLTEGKYSVVFSNLDYKRIQKTIYLTEKQKMNKEVDFQVDSLKIQQGVLGDESGK